MQKKKKPLKSLVDRLPGKESNSGGRLHVGDDSQTSCLHFRSTNRAGDVRGPRPACLPSVCTVCIQSDKAEEGIYLGGKKEKKQER